MYRVRIQQALIWVQKNERHLGALIFVLGFITDLLTFTLLSISLVNLAFAGYLIMACLSTLGSHWLYSRERVEPPFWYSALKVAFPLGAQYAIGSLLSGCLIFYTKSSVVAVSWPFLALLIIVFIGNEYFRNYRERLTFQSVLFFFTLYAYLIFALPLALHTLGPWIFLCSTLISIICFVLFLLVLSRVGRERFHDSLREISVATLVVVLLMVGSYFTGILPPIPLTMTDAGVYHALSHTGDSYVVEAEPARTWYQLLTSRTVHYVPGSTLYAYTAVSSPIRFSTAVVHHWERLDTKSGNWTTEARISFPISGGRDGGYRGYSELSALSPGSWRVSVETPEGQVIGQIPFTLVLSDSPPVMHEETH